MSETTVTLIRHGETHWNRERRMQGHTDTPLSATGRAQAEALARRLESMTFSALYSSDLSRALDTAAAIAARCGHEVLTDPRLRERCFGIFEGLTFDEMASRYPAQFERFRTRDPDHPLEGGETVREFQQRCMGCLGEIAARHPGEHVVVVTHGLVLDAVYRAAHNLSYDVPRPVPLLNASLNLFGHASGIWRLHSWGDIVHLAEVRPL